MNIIYLFEMVSFWYETTSKVGRRDRREFKLR